MRYISLKEFGISENKGFVVIPKGRNLWGWQGFSQVLYGLVDSRKPEIHGTENTDPQLRNPQPSDWIPDAQNQWRSFKDVMNQGEGVMISLPKIKGTLNGRSDKGKSISNDQIEICLQVILGYGLDGSWEVK